MKVKDFIVYLSKLDQEKDIWIVCNGGFGYVCSPACVQVYYCQFSSTQALQKLKFGDYIFDVS